MNIIQKWQKENDELLLYVCKLVTHAQRSYNMRQVVLGILGDIINGWIHEELVQTNSMKPMEAISMAKSLIVSGIKMLNEKLNVDKITVVCVVGNHARTTRKINSQMPSG